MQTAPRPWRCFVAVPLPGAMRDALRVWLNAARARHDLETDWRWADPEGWHITLAFLASTPPDAVPRILDRLASTAAQSAGFWVSARGLGGFPGSRHARVLWYGINDEERRLKELATAVRAATGTDEDSPFRPHVTLARARDRRGATLPSLLVETLPSARVPVSGIHLIRSHPGRGPTRYETLGAIDLGALRPVESHA
jgi:RNA 2',3'-cyclic 3'-phosphodiesterase